MTILQPIIEKARAEVIAKQPAKPPPAAAPAKAAESAKSAPSKPAKSLYDVSSSPNHQLSVELTTNSRDC